MAKKICIAMCVAWMLLVCSFSASAAAKVSERKAGELSMGDYINRSHYGSIAAKTRMGYVIGSYGSGLIYYPESFESGIKIYGLRGIRLVNDFADSRYSTFRASPDMPETPFYKESESQIYYLNGQLLLITKISMYAREGYRYTFDEKKLIAEMKRYLKGDGELDESMNTLVPGEEVPLITMIPDKLSPIPVFDFEKDGMIAIGMDYAFVNDAFYYSTMKPMVLKRYDVGSDNLSELIKDKSHFLAYDMVTDGEMLLFYAADTVNEKQSCFTYSLKTKKLVKIKDPMLDNTASTGNWTEQHRISSMQLVKLHASNEAWKQISQHRKQMQSWFIFEGSIYFHIGAKRGEMAPWHKIDLASGEYKQTKMQSTFREEELLNTIDGYLVIMSNGHTEILNLKRPQKAYMIDVGLSTKENFWDDENFD